MLIKIIKDCACRDAISPIRSPLVRALTLTGDDGWRN
jgi:hypothetical protein